ncbi:hypothetical protein QE152_g6350 [Popillia japonica]|uniref:Uncharacterized protein n=1 Tax=Popillia japonica TaxID=7064 RepID=A0AAW1MI56_POPJA
MFSPTHLLILTLSVAAVASAATEDDTVGPIFIREPQNRVDFSNSTGAVVECKARGNPPTGDHLGQIGRHGSRRSTGITSDLGQRQSGKPTTGDHLGQIGRHGSRRSTGITSDLGQRQSGIPPFPRRRLPPGGARSGILVLGEESGRHHPF